MKSLTASALVLLIATGIAGAQPPPPGYAPIPPPRVEVVPAPPRPTVVWQPGHWHWNGYRYIWIDGRYVERRPQYGRYIPGGWVWRYNHWVWMPAHWG